MRTKSFPVSTALVLFIGFFFAFSVVSLQQWYQPAASVLQASAPDEGVPVSEWNAYWRSVIKDTSPRVAYNSLVATYANEVGGTQHEYAHRFGALLYEELGPAAIELCDDRFFYGCYHEVIGQTLINEGVGSLAELAAACGPDLGCQHGVGHGVVAFHGYNEVALSTALPECDKVANPEVIDGCLGGVFMEYNMRTMLSSDDDHELRTFDANDPLAPCAGMVNEAARASCYFWIPQWLLEVEYHEPYPERFTRVGSLCREHAGAYTSRCFEGIGYNVNRYSEIDQRFSTPELCSYAAQTEVEYVDCMILAAADYAGGPYEDRAITWCNEMSESHQSRCRTTIEYSR
jgi:hypothetical protein